MKAAPGPALYKRCSEVWLCLGIEFALHSATSAEKKSCSTESGSLLDKLGVFLKIHLFPWDVELFWIFIEMTNSE